MALVRAGGSGNADVPLDAGFAGPELLADRILN